MTWDEVPAKLVKYDALEYAPADASATLLAYYGATSADTVNADRRDDFEADLDYRIGACENLAKSKAIRPSRLR